MIKKIIGCCLFLITGWYSSIGQVRFQRMVTTDYLDIELMDVLIDFEEKFDIKFLYESEWLMEKTISSKLENVRMEEALGQILGQAKLTFLFRDPNYVVLLKAIAESKSEITINKKSNNQQVFIGEIDPSIGLAIISGIIVNGENGQPLPGTIISIKSKGIRKIADSNGYYEIQLPPDDYNIHFHHQVMEDMEIGVRLNSNGTLNLEMFEDILRLSDVVIRGEAIDENVSQTVTGVENISLKTIKRIPALFGEADVFNGVIALPGVNKIGEGAAGYNVRGSNVGQNLILFDNATIYNPNHLFGFFSSFNADVVRNITFYRGSIPAEYGGRIASVLDVEMKNGNKSKLTGQGGVGILNSRLSLEGPIKKDTTSFIIGFRAAYPNYILEQFDNLDVRQSSSYFLDANLKIDHLINQNNRIAITGYFSRDNFNLANQAKYDYGNKALGITWNTTLRKSLFLDIETNITEYDYILSDTETVQLGSELESRINQSSIKADFDYFGNRHSIGFGGVVNLYTVDPGTYTPSNESSIIQALDIEDESALEAAIYIDDNHQINDQLSLYAGLRYSFYSGGQNGLKTINHGAEPRFAINYRTSSNSSIKLGYNRMKQYLQFISNTTAATPTDIWKLSNDRITPTIGQQITLGFFKNLNNDTYETSIEAFFKKTTDLLEYRDGADLFINENLEEELLQGIGRAYGLELYLKKNKGDLTGWLSYTYSRSEISVSGFDRLNSINGGNFFPTNFDQPHNLSLFSNWQASRRFGITANFNYNTGRPITYPESFYVINDISIINYSDRNRYRIPDYHRLDLSFIMTTSLKREKKIEANWAISIYNVYGRRNTYSIFYRNESPNQTPQAFKLSIIGRPVVAISYNFKF